MDNFNLRHTAFALILFFSITLFVDLDKAEIQPWDEGLYAYRAKAALEHNAWWDQTDYAIGGLYSSTYPPLTVDIMAFAMKYFNPVLAVRMFSFFSAVISLLLIFLIARRFLSPEMSLMSIIGLAVTLMWDKYARQGMTDVPLVMFSLLGLWAILKISESKSLLYALLWGVLFALSFAAALMSKILVSFLPGLFALVFIFNKFEKSRKFIVIGGALAGIALALPWHLYMYNTYGDEFLRAFFARHIYTAVEANTRSLGVLYYINQLIVSNPFFIFALVFLLTAIFKYRKIFPANENVQKKFLLILMTIWFGGLLILFSLSITKMPYYLIYLTVPAVLLSAYLYENYDDLIGSEKTRHFVFALIIISLLWSFNFGLRQEIKQVLILKNFTVAALAFVFISLLLIGISLFIKNKKASEYITRNMPRVLYFIVIILVIRLIMFNVNNKDIYILGGKHTAKVLERSGSDSFVYIYHEYNGSDSLNPQLAWYSHGWNLHERPGKYYYPVPMPKNKISMKAISSTDKFANAILVYYVPDNIELAYGVIREIKKTRNIMYLTKNYIIFGTVKRKRQKEKSV